MSATQTDETPAPAGVVPPDQTPICQGKEARTADSSPRQLVRKNRPVGSGATGGLSAREGVTRAGKPPVAPPHDRGRLFPGVCPNSLGVPRTAEGCAQRQAPPSDEPVESPGPAAVGDFVGEAGPIPLARPAHGAHSQNVQSAQSARAGQTPNVSHNKLERMFRDGRPKSRPYHSVPSACTGGVTLPRSIVRLAREAAFMPGQTAGPVTQGVPTPLNNSRRKKRTRPPVNCSEYEVEARLGFKLSVPDNIETLGKRHSARGQAHPPSYSLQGAAGFWLHPGTLGLPAQSWGIGSHDNCPRRAVAVRHHLCGTAGPRLRGTHQHEYARGGASSQQP